MLPEPLSASAARTLLTLLDGGPATRPVLSRATGVTKQTVSSAVAELEGRGLVAPDSVQQGRVGRSALRYALAPSSGWIGGVDLGATRVRVAAARLDGTVVAERLVLGPRTADARGWPGQLEAAAAALAELAQQLTEAAGGLIGLGLAVPRVVPEPRDLVGDRLDEGDAALLDALAPVAPAAVWAENDVNCEALAQLRYRPDPPSGPVLHLHVGAGLGAALLVDGRIVRGARGRAGEVGQLPAPAGPGTADAALGAGALLARAGHSPDAPLAAAIADLFAAAAIGDPAAESSIQHEAEGLAAVIGVLTAVLDPAVVVLSGVVGAQADLRVRVADALARAGVRVPVVEDPLGDGAAVLGAVAVAVERVLAGLGSRP